MSDHILVGRGPEILQHSIEAFRSHLEEASRSRSPRLRFMTRDHHLVRDTIVRELPRAGGPLGPSALARRTSLGVDRVEEVLDELERNLFFLVRVAGEVRWAFPVTVEATPHLLTFSSGERIYAA